MEQVALQGERRRQADPLQRLFVNRRSVLALIAYRSRLRGSKKNQHCGVVAPMKFLSSTVIVGALLAACSAANGQAPAPPAAPVQQAAPGSPSAQREGPKSDAKKDLKSDKTKKKAKAKKKAAKASPAVEG